MLVIVHTRFYLCCDFKYSYFRITLWFLLQVALAFKLVLAVRTVDLFVANLRRPDACVAFAAQRLTISVDAPFLASLACLVTAVRTVVFAVADHHKRHARAVATAMSILRAVSRGAVELVVEVSAVIRSIATPVVGNALARHATEMSLRWAVDGAAVHFVLLVETVHVLVTDEFGWDAEL